MHFVYICTLSLIQLILDQCFESLSLFVCFSGTMLTGPRHSVQ